MDKKQWSECARLLLAAYGPRRFDPETLQAWYEMLSDQDGQRVKDGVLKMIKAEAYPTIAAIHKACEPSFWDIQEWRITS